MTYTAQLPSGWGHSISAERNLSSRLDMLSAQSQFRSSLDDSSMHSSGDLAILGADRYDVGIKYPSAPRTSKRGKKTAATATVTEMREDAPPKKRRKASSSDDVGDEDDKMKRGRGRPRLEPKDETAQDVSSLRVFLFSFLEHNARLSQLLHVMYTVDIPSMDNALTQETAPTHANTSRPTRLQKS